MLPKLIALVRSESLDECRTIVNGLAQAGVPGIEVTMTVPGATEALRQVTGSISTIGAGTVVDAESCQACIDAGARFIVSPVTDLAVLDQARRGGVPYVGGALSPSEILASLRTGCDAIKLFPISAVGGPGYLRAVREPFPQLRAVVSGRGSARRGRRLLRSGRARRLHGERPD